MIHVYDGHGLRFAVWTGPGRDPQVAYLDGRTFAIATSELGSRAWLLHAQRLSQNALGGARRGAIDPAAVHRMSHCVLDTSGSPVFELDPPCHGAIGSDGLYDTARQDPGPVTVIEDRIGRETGSAR